MFISRRFVTFANVLVVLSTFSGCGGDKIKMAAVEGNVKLDGKPLDKIMVEFWPQSDGPRSFGETDSAGHFSLKTDDGKLEGASVGSHKVILKDVGVLGDKFLGRAGENVDMSNGKKPRISGKYSSPETTSITKSVEAGKKNEFDLEVTSK
ncbi:MAG TPA: hypothetical protein VM260_04480 [Pirellula sp.]|nr:hypothetical protein [Pirellula sp.]